MTTKPRTRRTTTKKTASAPAPKPADKQSGPRLTVIDMRKPLPVRRTTPGPYTPAQLAEARAALAAAYARLPIPVINWQTLPDNRTAAYMADDTLIVHTAHRAPLFTALILCPQGRRHEHPITDQATLHTARNLTRGCTSTHGAATDDQHQALTEGVTTPPPPPVIRAPKAITPVKVLADRLAKSSTSNDDTQANDVTDLRNAAADDTAKEHPDHD